jgi:hypothetical protein
VPLVTAGCFREGFFFSFLGLIVSELGFVLMLPPDPCTPAPCANATWGIDVTVSVSTVMLCEVLSPVFPFPGGFKVEVLDCREVSGAGAVAEALLLSVIMLPLSLPLSLGANFGFGLELEACTSAGSCCHEASEVTLSSRFSNAFSTLC